jgi:hypothetical protein
MVKAKDLIQKQDQLHDHDVVRRIVREELMEHLQGEGFWDNLLSAVKPVASVVKNVASIIPHPAAQGVSKALGVLGAGKGGRKKAASRHTIEEAALEGSGPISDLGIPVISGLAGLFGLGHEGNEEKPKKKRQLSAKMQKRNELIRQIMREEGMSLAQASRYIKEHALV